jgi:hypothetical protein
MRLTVFFIQVDCQKSTGLCDDRRYAEPALASGQHATIRYYCEGLVPMSYQIGVRLRDPALPLCALVQLPFFQTTTLPGSKAGGRWWRRNISPGKTKGKGGAVGHAAVSSSHPAQTRERFGCHSRKETDSLPFGAELKQPGRLEQR